MKPEWEQMFAMFPVDFEWHIWDLERKRLENSGTFKLIMNHLNSGMGCPVMWGVSLKFA